MSDALKRARSSWANMKNRCLNPNAAKWPRYGGRGIGVCVRWLSFEAFLADMGTPPPGHTIDRIDNDGPYDPTNCRWADIKTQGANRVMPHGEGHSASVLTDADVREIRRLAASGLSGPELGRRFGIGKSTVQQITSRQTWRHVA